MKSRSRLLMTCCLFVTLNALAQEKVFDVSIYGAIGDGKTVNTEVLQNTIDL